MQSVYETRRLWRRTMLAVGALVLLTLVELGVLLYSIV